VAGLANARHDQNDTASLAVGTKPSHPEFAEVLINDIAVATEW
jgi:hypothetical protein